MSGDEKSFFTVDEMLDEVDKTPRYMRLWYWFNRQVSNVRRFQGKVKNVYQRARYGVGYRDAWSLDTHVARVLNHGARHLYEANNSYPGEHNGWTEEQWQVFLMELSTASEVYADDHHDNEYFVNQYKKLLHQMVDNFETMWD